MPGCRRAGKHARRRGRVGCRAVAEPPGGAAKQTPKVPREREERLGRDDGGCLLAGGNRSFAAVETRTESPCSHAHSAPGCLAMLALVWI